MTKLTTELASLNRAEKLTLSKLLLESISEADRLPTYAEEIAICRQYEEELRSAEEVSWDAIYAACKTWV